MSAGRNQRERILDLLVEAHAQEVPSVALSRISLQYGARVKELREMGFRISNRTERRAGKVYGYFRLESSPIEPPTISMRAEIAPVGENPRLFSEAELQRGARWVDPEELR